jgi:hypothetical protein
VNFRALPSQLVPVAEAVARFLNDQLGLTRLKSEEAAKDILDYRPTLQAVTLDHHDVWVEVSELPYLKSLDSVILQCVTTHLPVKLYVAFPEGVPPAVYKTNVDEARRKGVGAIEISNGNCHVIHEALPLSLAGVRVEDHKKFPSRLRQNLSNAENTFRNGDPSKGCSLIFDEIEGLSRRLAKRINARGFWKPSKKGPPQTNFDVEAWANVMDLLINRADLTKLPVGATKNLLIRVAAMVDPRNAAGHKPNNRAKRIQRDRESRTRFENAVDVLRDFAHAVRPLRL